MNKPVFLSWSGKFGETIAAELKHAIEKSITNIDIEMMSPKDRHGLEWRKKLSNILNNAAIGIFVLTPECGSSWFLPWEIGMLSAEPSVTDNQGHIRQNRDVRSYALTFGLPDLDKYKQDPGKMHDLGFLAQMMDRNCWPLARESFARLVEALVQYHPGTPAPEWKRRPNDPEFDSDIWLQLSEKIEPLRQQLEEIKKREMWIARVRGSLLNELTADREDELGYAVQNLVLSAGSDPGVFSELINLLAALEPPTGRPRRRAIVGTSEEKWSKFEAEQCEREIQHAANRVTDVISRGALELQIQDAANTFITDILSRVQNSMWTINVGNYEGSFGRGSDPDMLKAHKAVVEANPKAIIQRVFVVDATVSATNLSSKAAVELGDIMRQQEAHNVETYGITQKDFKHIADRNTSEFRRIRSIDFNILDDCRVYITHVNDNRGAWDPTNTGVNWIRLSSDPLVVRDAKYLRDIIMKKATRVTNGDLTSFFVRI